MKKAFVFLAVILFTAVAVAEVQYEVEFDEEKVYTNVSIVSDCDQVCPGLSWRLMEGSKVLDVDDGSGELEYSREDDVLSIEGERTREENRTVKIQSVVNSSAEHVHEGLYERQISLPSFQDKKTTGVLKNPDIISGRADRSFESSFGEDRIEFRGEGPTNIIVNFGQGYSTEYFEFFGDVHEDPDDAFRLAVGTLEVGPQFERFAVSVMNEEEYMAEHESWSAGQYRSGSIKLRDDLDDNFLRVLAHETAHGLNDRKLSWDETSSSYFDEGTAEYVEFLMQKKRYREEETDIGPQELFGEETQYTDTDNPNRYYQVPPQGDKEQLWNYYRQEEDFMKYWSPAESAEHRNFGYAYSQLVIRNHIKENGTLNEVYEEMDSLETTESYDTKWSFFSSHMDMEPCNYDSRERFEQCLDDINSFDYEINMADHDYKQGELEIDRINLPNRTRESSGELGGEEVERFLFNLSQLVDRLIQSFQDLISIF